jgi:murein DD-endopeptidase MepM/ murein hydrolase activator NlpD
VIASCARCRGELALHVGRPRILGDGRVELFCDACWANRDTTIVALPVVVAASPAPKRRHPTRIAIVVAALAIGGAGIAIATRETPAAAAFPALDDLTWEPISERVREHAPDDPPPEPIGEPEGEPSIATFDGEPLDERFPTLKEWTHPVTDSDEVVPVRAARKFGAHRDGVDRDECGDGHCGLDLTGPRGRPVVAVAWGTVVRIEHSENGRDGHSGRYVRIEHPDGVFTAYMHLDSIVASLAVGDEVDAGQVIGTLGKTAIRNGEEHLHFNLEIIVHGQIRFVDPTPYLAGAKVVPIPARVEGAIAPADRSQW